MHNIVNLPTVSGPIEAARDYVANGWALVPIAKGTKGPKTAGWNRQENCVTSADQCVRIKGNVGLAHLYSRTCVLDFDDLGKARVWLSARGVDLDEIWAADEAVRISSGRPNRGKLLFRLPPGVDSLPSYNLQEDGIELRCATAGGLTVQDVLPPSVHPDTGQPYTWEYADDLVGDWRHPPVLPAAVLKAWQSLSAVPAAAQQSTEWKNDKEPLGLSRTEMRKLLAQLDSDAPFPEWINVGLALHHEFRGGQVGFDLWDEWSAGAAKYRGTDDLVKHWSTFGRSTGPLVTARSLMQLACIASVDDFDDMTIEAPAAAKPKFSIAQAGTFAAGAAPGWMIKGVLPKAELAVVYGESGAGKSFVLIDMMGAIARGVEWRGMRVKQGRVVYVCAEGMAGFRKRLTAYGQHHGVDLNEIPLGVISDVPNLLSHDDKAIAKQVEAWGGADVIVFDTLAQSTPGANENASDGMGKALEHCKRLHVATGALIILVAHSGKDSSKGVRGWSGIKGAADVQIEVVRAQDHRAIRLDKQKDDKDGEEFGFKLHTVAIGEDEDGEDITSCVIEHTAAVPKAERKREPRSDKHKLVLRMAKELVEVGDDQVAVNVLIEACVGQMLHDPSKKIDNRRRDVARALEALVGANQIAIADGYVSLQ